MERPVSVLRQRTTSFNPEAAAFSPALSSPLPQDIVLVPNTSPTPPRDTDHTFAMAPMFNYSPFHDIGSARSLYRRDPLTLGPVRLEDFLSPDAQALVKKLEEHPDVQEIRAPQTPKLEAAPAAKVVQDTTPSLPPFTFPKPESQPDYITVDINELSAGLGLPSVKADANEDASPAASHKSRTSQAHPGALYGKLIGWALDKPLTAKGLAEFLQNQDVNTPSKPPPSASVSPARTLIQQEAKPSPSERKAKSPPRDIAPNSRRITTSTPTETITVPKGPSAHQHQHRRSSTSTASYRQHTRVPSHRRYPRRPSRAKRMDQGPMPSAADIYPDDFHFTPTSIYESQATSYLQPPELPEPAQVVVDNPFNWPLPAQAYAPEPPPSLADLRAADSDVLALMNELPEPSLCTLAKLGNTHDLRATSAFDLPCDERALSPGQEDGSRYGIRFWGLGYGDQWEVPKTSCAGEFGASEQFRVRPRKHEGRGGWEWARMKGWLE